MPGRGHAIPGDGGYRLRRRITILQRAGRRLSLTDELGGSAESVLDGALRSVNDHYRHWDPRRLQLEAELLLNDREQ
jgi:fibrillarin-like rRNA methylase